MARKRYGPEQIIRMLEADENIERRQFGIIDMQGRTAGRSGERNGAVSMDIQGESDDGILWSVQGNIIATEEALTAAATGALYVIVNQGETDHDRNPLVTLRLDGDVTTIVPQAIELALAG